MPSCLDNVMLTLTFTGHISEPFLDDLDIMPSPDNHRRDGLTFSRQHAKIVTHADTVAAFQEAARKRRVAADARSAAGQLRAAQEKSDAALVAKSDKARAKKAQQDGIKAAEIARVAALTQAELAAHLLQVRQAKEAKKQQAVAKKAKAAADLEAARLRQAVAPAAMNVVV